MRPLLSNSQSQNNSKYRLNQWGECWWRKQKINLKSMITIKTLIQSLSKIHSHKNILVFTSVLSLSCWCFIFHLSCSASGNGTTRTKRGHLKMSLSRNRLRMINNKNLKPKKYNLLKPIDFHKDHVCFNHDYWSHNRNEKNYWLTDKIVKSNIHLQKPFANLNKDKEINDYVNT